MNNESDISAAITGLRDTLRVKPTTEGMSFFIARGQRVYQGEGSNGVEVIVIAETSERAKTTPV